MTTPTPTDLPEALNKLMEQAQVFASTWSSVGGPFDDGSTMERAEEEKALLRSMIGAALAAPTTEQSSEVAPAPWRSAVLDLIDDCPGLTMEQDQWLSRRVKELDFPSAAQPKAGAESYLPSDADALEKAMKERWLQAGSIPAIWFANGWATAALRARGAVPSDASEGFAVVYVNGFDDLMIALAHADRKGRLPHNVQVRWGEFDYRRPTAPQPPAALPGEQDAARLDFVLSELRRDGMDMLLSALHDEDGFPLDKTQSVIAIDAAMAAKGRADGGAA